LIWKKKKKDINDRWSTPPTITSKKIRGRGATI